MRVAGLTHGFGIADVYAEELVGSGVGLPEKCVLADLLTA